MRVFKNNEELKSLIIDGNIFITENIYCNFNIDLEANINAWNINAKSIDAWNIKAKNIDAWNIKASNINALDINASNIDAKDINAWNIDAKDINAKDINAWDINAWNINAWDIKYFAFCIAYISMNYNTITGRRKNSFHKILDK